ncbi:MAG: hypothetical protein M3Y72_05550 [Acidobacteriota bacterium]|nr:hypothetical protein [Acidobacteriota bacterium]
MQAEKIIAAPANIGQQASGSRNKTRRLRVRVGEWATSRDPFYIALWQCCWRF